MRCVLEKHSILKLGKGAVCHISIQETDWLGAGEVTIGSYIFCYSGHSSGQAKRKDEVAKTADKKTVTSVNS